MKDEYKVIITESSRELSKKETIAYKDISEAIVLDEVVTEVSPAYITPVGYVLLAVHNEKSDNKDYTKFVILDDTGNRYVTGSDTFYGSFMEIWEEMLDETGNISEPYQIKVGKKPSKNVDDAYFLTCNIVV